MPDRFDLRVNPDLPKQFQKWTSNHTDTQAFLAAILEHNRQLHQPARDAALTILHMHRWRKSDMFNHFINGDVALLIARHVYASREDPEWQRAT